jgi:CheY-like chemotaxis protein
MMKYRVLIVDDSKLARLAVIKALNALHPEWSRVEAANTDDALKSMTEDAPDIALVDFNMPGRDGLELAAELRRMSPGLPVAVISANHQQEIVNRARAVGATFLPKPLVQEALSDFLKSAVRDLEARR